MYNRSVIDMVLLSSIIVSVSFNADISRFNKCATMPALEKVSNNLAITFALTRRIGMLCICCQYLLASG